MSASVIMSDAINHSINQLINQTINQSIKMYTAPYMRRQPIIRTGRDYRYIECYVYIGGATPKFLGGPNLSLHLLPLPYPLFFSSLPIPISSPFLPSLEVGLKYS